MERMNVRVESEGDILGINLRSGQFTGERLFCLILSREGKEIGFLSGLTESEAERSADKIKNDKTYQSLKVTVEIAPEGVR